MIQIPENCLKALQILNDKGYEAYIVGGCVRDALLHKEPEDWDICTNATPDEMMEVFQGYHIVPTGIDHGTLTIFIKGSPFEITTYRIDGEYEDHRRPKEVSYTTNLEEDLSRRDFTINAMAYHPKEGLIDCFGGKQDLQDRILRAVGDPLLRFEEDGLRIMRLVRFATVLDFDYEEKTLAAVPQKVHLLRHIAKERIQTELNKLLLAKSVARGLDDLYTLSMYPYIFPQICHERNFYQKGGRHFLDVFDHSVLATGLIEPDLTLRLTMLLHDIGKPFCWEEVDADEDRFPGHEFIGADIANKLLRDLKYDNKTRKEVVKLIRHHNDIIHEDMICVRKMLRILGEDSFRRLLKVKVADILAHYLSYKRRAVTDMFKRIERMVDDTIDAGYCVSLAQLAVDGKDMIELGFEGKEIREVLNKALDEVIVYPERNKREYLMEFCRDYTV